MCLFPQEKPRKYNYTHLQTRLPGAKPVAYPAVVGGGAPPHFPKIVQNVVENLFYNCYNKNMVVMFQLNHIAENYVITQKV